MAEEKIEKKKGSSTPNSSPSRNILLFSLDVVLSIFYFLIFNGRVFFCVQFSHNL